MRLYIRFGAPACDVNANLNLVTATGIDVSNNGDPEHVIGVIPDFSKPDIEDQCVESSSSAQSLKDAMVDEIVYYSVRVAVTGVLIVIKKIGLVDTTDRNILELRIPSETEKIKRPS